MKLDAGIDVTFVIKHYAGHTIRHWYFNSDLGSTGRHSHTDAFDTKFVVYVETWLLSIYLKLWDLFHMWDVMGWCCGCCLLHSFSWCILSWSNKALFCFIFLLHNFVYFHSKFWVSSWFFWNRTSLWLVSEF